VLKIHPRKSAPSAGKNHFLFGFQFSVFSFFLFVACATCAAQVDPWEFEVYPYSTTPRGMAEFETDNAVVARGHGVGGEGTAQGTFPSQKMWNNAYEITYGLTDRIEAAIYLNMAQPNGHGLRWAGNNVRLRGRLFDQDVLPVDIGWYAELEWHKTPQFDDAARELELRPIRSLKKSWPESATIRAWNSVMSPARTTAGRGACRRAWNSTAERD
jgi:hypothetical protein